MESESSASVHPGGASASWAPTSYSLPSWEELLSEETVGAQGKTLLPPTRLLPLQTLVLSPPGALCPGQGASAQ